MASVASQFIEEVTAHAQSDSLEDAWEICADSTYFPNNLHTVLHNYIHPSIFLLYLHSPSLVYYCWGLFLCTDTACMSPGAHTDMYCICVMFNFPSLVIFKPPYTTYLTVVYERGSVLWGQLSRHCDTVCRASLHCGLIWATTRNSRSAMTRRNPSIPIS